MQEDTDDLGRPTLAPDFKDALGQAFTVVPPGKKGALVLIARPGDSVVRAHLAANLDGNGDWKVAAGTGWEWGKKKPESGFIVLAGSW